ncbi:Alcohol dehydrogenase transcription factor Myb/SANT-like family protein [Euphorbia peplus]|nr:Alcohol dehydrogenase transcription factor Myb/SANT-like family protein [Euphorbia peplus]
MDNMQDEPRFPPKSYSQNRSRRVPLYSLPPQSNPNPNFNPDYPQFDHDDFNDDDDEFENPQFDANYEFDRYPKRQKLKNPIPNYEFVARSSNSMPPDWTEHEKFVLLEVWGDRFLQLGRNSLRSEDWVLVSEKVSEALKIDRTEVQCKQMMDLLKRRYKKERAKGGGGGGKWAYFRKMDMLMSRGRSGGECSLACGVDSGEFVFMDTDVYLERANVNDEMRDSPCDSEEEDEEEGGGKEGVKGLRVLADSVKKFGKIYEKIESSKREQMLELEKMRSEFQRELELQKKQILERAQVEIAKIREVNDDDQDDDDEDDDSDDDDDDDDDNVTE